MHEIVVPIDFSKTSINALDFAIELAKVLEMDLKLLHIYTPMGVSLDDAAYVAHEEVRSEYEEKLETSCERCMERLEGSGVNASHELDYGFPAKRIVDWSKEDTTSMIVMGSTGQTGAFEKVFGKVSTDVSVHAHCPVLLVPHESTYKGIHKLIYTSKYIELDSSLMPYLGKLASKLGSNISLVHQTEKGEIDYSIHELKAELEKHAPEIQVEAELEHADSIAEVLKHFVEERDIDLVVMASKHRDFFSRLFHKSAIKSMAFSTRVPLLILHEGGRRSI
jgi:nucleotide-binding universal stress UspA family protein